MDFEEVEQRVLRAPLQELDVPHESGFCVLGKLHTNDPYPWYIGYKPTELASWEWYRGVSLSMVVHMVEQVYPDFRSRAFNQ